MPNTHPIYTELADLILELQMAMQEAKVWDCEQPTPQALASIEPFCVDTMTLEQWLRYVFIERFKLIIEQGLPLPGRCQIAPMVSESFKSLPAAQVKYLHCVLDALDRFLSRSHLS